MLRFLCSCSYLFTFLLSSQFYWRIRLKSTAYFFEPPCKCMLYSGMSHSLLSQSYNILFLLLITVVSTLLYEAWDWPSGSESRSPSSRRALALTTKYKIETLYTDNVADAVCLSMTFILFSLRYTTVCHHQGRRWKFLPMGSKVRGSGDGSLPVGSRGEAPVGGRGDEPRSRSTFWK